MKSGCPIPVAIINPLPEDATIVRIFQDDTLGTLNIVLASETFDELNEGDIIPLIQMPQFEHLQSVVL